MSQYSNYGKISTFLYLGVKRYTETVWVGLESGFAVPECNHMTIMLILITCIEQVLKLNLYHNYYNFGFVKFQMFMFCFKGVSGSIIRTEMAKLRNLSLSLEELTESFRVTFCYRRLIIDKHHPSFLELVELIPCYVSLPQVVCYTLCSVSFPFLFLGNLWQHFAR